MRLFSSIFIIALVALIAGCSSVTVNFDYDSEYDFATYKTFKWGVMDVANDALKQDPMTAKRINDAIQKVLIEKGYTLIDDENVDPDFVVVTHAGVKERMQIHNTGGYSRGWYDPWWGAYGGSTHVSRYEEGTLVIDIVDMGNKELAWRGLGTKILANKTGEKQIQEIENVVRRIMTNFPPPAE